MNESNKDTKRNNKIFKYIIIGILFVFCLNLVWPRISKYVWGIHNDPGVKRVEDTISETGRRLSVLERKLNEETTALREGVSREREVIQEMRRIIAEDISRVQESERIVREHQQVIRRICEAAEAQTTNGKVQH